MRTELVLRHFNTDEEHWQDVEALATTESPRYLARAVVALANDENLKEKNGKVLLVGELAKQYGFTDVDGRQPPPFEVPDMTSSS